MSSETVVDLAGSHVAAFVADCLVTVPGASLATADIRMAYEAWCVANGHEPLSQQKLSAELLRLGVTEYRAGLDGFLGEEVPRPLTSGDITTSGCEPSQRQLLRKERSYANGLRRVGARSSPRSSSARWVSVHCRVPLVAAEKGHRGAGKEPVLLFADVCVELARV